MSVVVVEMCMGTSCHLLGAQDLMEALDTLPLEKRSLIELKGATCLKSCRKGPNVRINGEMFSEITPERFLTVIEENLSLLL